MPLKLSTNSVFTATDTGAYFVMATYKDGCTVASNSFNVRLNDAFLTISADGANLSAQTNANITSYQWVKDNIYLSNGVEAEFLVMDVGEYQLIAVDEFGCTLTSNKVFVGVTETKNEEKLDLMLFPNPAKDYVFVQFENYEKAKIVVTDAIGRIMINTEAEGKEIKLSTAHFPLGIYLVEITTTKGRETVKLVKD